MPPIRNTQQLRENAGSVGFLRNGSDQYQTVNRFAQKLLDLQDALRNTNETALREQVSKYARDLMNLQLHDTPMVSADRKSVV